MHIFVYFLSYFDSESHFGRGGRGDQGGRGGPEGVAINTVPGGSWGPGPGFGARKSITVLHVSIN